MKPALDRPGWVGAVRSPSARERRRAAVRRDPLHRLARACARLLALPARRAARPLQRYLLALFNNDNLVCVAYPPEGQPRDLFHWIPVPALASHYLDNYLPKAYLADPFYQLAISDRPAGIYRLADVAPDKFFSSEYHRHFYARSQMIDELCVLSRLEDGTALQLSLGRFTVNGAFHARELALLQRLEPLLIEWLNRLGRDSPAPPPGTPHPPLAQRVRERAPALTRREAQIVAMLLQGHSSLSIGLNLGISAQTVKVHRRNLYRKLRISSQAELFQRFAPLVV